MAQRNTATLVYQIENGRIDINTLTRKERRAVEKSMAVSEEAREHQSAQAIANNQYVEKVHGKRVKTIKAEKIGLDWSFSEQGFRHFIKEIENMFEGTKNEVGGFLIHKVNDNEAVMYQQ